jgi:hypothetical protein
MESTKKRALNRGRAFKGKERGEERSMVKKRKGKKKQSRTRSEAARIA